jgi:hypothetical protein
MGCCSSTEATQTQKNQNVPTKSNQTDTSSNTKETNSTLTPTTNTSKPSVTNSNTSTVSNPTIDADGEGGVETKQIKQADGWTIKEEIAPEQIQVQIKETTEIESLDMDGIGVDESEGNKVN